MMALLSLDRRERAGLLLLAVLVASLLALWLAGKWVIGLERRVLVSAEISRRIGRLLVGALGVVAVCGVIAVAVSSRGLTGTVSNAVDSITSTKGTSDYNPGRLLSVASQNRVVWWEEAAGAFSDRPLVEFVSVVTASCFEGTIENVDSCPTVVPPCDTIRTPPTSSRSHDRPTASAIAPAFA